MKAVISKFLRQLNLLHTADKVRFFLAKSKNTTRNKDFQSKHKDFIFPPEYLMYESFQLNYESYYSSGKAAANFLFDTFRKYNEEENPKILDWGCGPARIVRHISEKSQKGNVFATDYNAETIAWNKQNIQGVEFNLNPLEAVLPYDDSFFDFIYGISIFTHLSEKLHFEWKNELTRVLKSDGVLLLSLQGDLFKTILIESEIQTYNSGNIVVRGNVKEGHRTYSAFHPEKFVRELFSDFTVMEHIPSYENNGKPEQDIWVLKKH